MKNKEKKVRITPIFIGVLMFIILAVGLVNYELNSNKMRAIHLYNSQMDITVESLSLLIKDKQAAGSLDEEIVNQLPQIFNATGDCFLVYEKNDEVIFAKTLANTQKLYENTDGNSFWENIRKQDIQVSSSSWENNSGKYKLSIVSETNGISDRMSITKHNYYILLTLVVGAIVLFSMLVTYMGILRKTTKNLNRTTDELKTRNANIEQFISDEQNNIRKGKEATADADFEKSFSRLEKFMDISVLRNLLSKSNSDDLKPIKLIVIKFIMSDRYYSANEIISFAQCITNSVKKREALFELRKGLFAVVLYKSNDAEVELRKKAILEKLNDKNKEEKLFVGFGTEVFELGSGEDAVIEDFEKVYKEITG